MMCRTNEKWQAVMSLSRTFSLTVYGIFGAGALAGGVAALFVPTGWVPGSANLGGEEQHLMQEFGSALVFVGLMALWCAFHLRQSRVVHYFLMAFFALIALVHWWDFTRDPRPLMSPLVNTLPLVILGVVGWVNHVDRRRESQLRVGG